MKSRSILVLALMLMLLFACCCSGVYAEQALSEQEELSRQYEECLEQLDVCYRRLSGSWFTALRGYFDTLVGPFNEEAFYGSGVQFETLEVIDGCGEVTEGAPVFYWVIAWKNDGRLLNVPFDSYDDPSYLCDPAYGRKEDINEYFYKGVEGMVSGEIRLVTIPNDTTPGYDMTWRAVVLVTPADEEIIALKARLHNIHAKLYALLYP